MTETGMAPPAARPASVLPRRAARGWRLLGRMGPAGICACALVAAILLVALLAPFLAPYNPDTMDIFARLHGPSWAHPMGTDQIGRDVLSRIIWGTRTVMIVASASLGLAALGGICLGLIAGYGPRWLDGLILLVFDSVISLPVLIFALAIVTLLGPSTLTLILIIAVFTLPGYGRVVRSQTLVLKRTDYILAARSMAASVPRILVLHVLPNLIGPLLVLVCMDVTTVITVESGLSFIGLGVQPPTPSWGGILNDGYSFIRQDGWLVFAAGLPILIATLGFNFLGEALRDLLDPRMRGRR